MKKEYTNSFAKWKTHLAALAVICLAFSLPGNAHYRAEAKVQGYAPVSSYCMSGLYTSTLCDLGLGIYGFSLGAHTNTTGCNVSGDATFYSSDTLEAAIGSSAMGSITVGSVFNQHSGIWIDFNADGDFNDTNEFVYASTNAFTGTQNYTFALPSSATSGLYRLRVRTKLGGLPLIAGQSCAALSPGETEDYVLRIAPPPPPAAATGLDFDGVNDRVQSGPLSIVGSISIEAWVKPGSKFTFSTILSTKAAGLYNPGFLFAINQYNTSNGKLVFETNNAAVFSNASVTWDVWQHVAFTYDGTTAKMYINGVDVGTSTYNTGVNLQGSSGPAFIGYLYGTNTFNGNFKGALDEVRIWNKALTASEITAKKDRQLNGNETGLVAYYNFNTGIVNSNNTGLTTLADQTSNGNNGTLNNFALNGGSSNWTIGAVTGNCTPNCANPVSVTMQPYNGAHFLSQLDPYTFYFGTTQWKRIRASHTGGVGPFTYTWGKVGTGQLKGNLTTNNIYLFEPFGPTKVYVTVGDVGTGCSTTDTLSISWDKQYFCGTMTPRSYKLVICENGITKCVSWKTAKTLIKGDLASLGPCISTTKTAPRLTVKVYPNPTSSTATLEYFGEKPSKGTLTVMDMNGRVLQQAEIQVSTGAQYQSIDLNGLPNGIYFVRLNTDYNVFAEKLQLLK